MELFKLFNSIVIHSVFLYVYVASQRHVIRLTPSLKRLGLQRDMDLGPVVGETTATGPRACAELCSLHETCNTAMLTGQLCRLFASASCPGCYSELTHTFNASRYVLGHNYSVRSFRTAMTRCEELGAHSVHIDTPEEHAMIKEYIPIARSTCQYIWTGGFSHISASPNIDDWRWYFNNDLDITYGRPFGFLAWAPNYPVDYPGQHALVLTKDSGYRFSTSGVEISASSSCYLCECP